MSEQPYHEEDADLEALLQVYEQLRSGNGGGYLEEEAYERIINHFDDQDDLAGALEAATLAIEQFPYSSQLHIKRADLLIAARKFQDALQELDAAELLNNSDINLYVLRIDAYLAMDNPTKAEALFQEALVEVPEEEQIDLMFELSDVFDDYEEFEKVFDCLKRILERDGENQEALFKICFWTDFTGRNEESIKLHQKIIEQHPYSELAWFNLGTAYQGLKLYEKAIDAYQYALAIDEKMDYAYRNMGDAYIRLHKYKDAIEALTKVLELTRPEDVIFEALGHCHDKLKQYTKARIFYRKAAHISPEDSKLYFKLAGTYANEGQYELAIKQMESALKLHRYNPEFNLLVGECYLQLGQYKDAIPYFSQVVRHRSRGVKGWEALIRCLFLGDYWDEALVQVNTALKVLSGKPLFIFYKSAILFALGKNKEAILFLDDAMSKAPKLLKSFVALKPSILQNTTVVDLIARYRRNKSF